MKNASKVVPYVGSYDKAPEPDDGRRWYSLNVHYLDSNVIVGPVDGEPGGSYDVWATGEDFAESVMNAIRYVEGEGHCVGGVIVNP